MATWPNKMNEGFRQHFRFWVTPVNKSQLISLSLETKEITQSVCGRRMDNMSALRTASVSALQSVSRPARSCCWIWCCLDGHRACLQCKMVSWFWRCKCLSDSVCLGCAALSDLERWTVHQGVPSQGAQPGTPCHPSDLGAENSTGGAPVVGGRNGTRCPVVRRFILSGLQRTTSHGCYYVGVTGG